MRPQAPALKPDLMLEHQLCFALYSTALGVTRVYRQLLKPLGLTYPQYLVMLVLWEHDGVNVSDICTRLCLETPTLTPLLKRLEILGLLERRRAAKDERQVIVRLTQSGAALRRSAAEVPDRLAAATGRPMPELVDLRERLLDLRGRLADWR